MNRKDFKIDRKKANTQDLRKKEKENRKLQLELNQERENVVAELVLAGKRETWQRN